MGSITPYDMGSINLLYKFLFYYDTMLCTNTPIRTSDVCLQDR